MTGWIIAISVFCVIFMLLASSIRITLNVSQQVLFRVSLLGFELFSFKSDESRPKNSVKEKSKAKLKEKETNKLTSLLREYTRNKSDKESVLEILSFIKEVCKKFAKLIRHIRFRKLKFNLTVATSDAAQTAILYGNLCSVVYSISGMLKSAYNFNAKEISVDTDFTSEKLKFHLESTIKIRIWFILMFALSVAFSIIKLKLGELKNGRA